MKRIASSFAGRCCQCEKPYAEGAEVYYDATAQRGKRSYCVNCGEVAAFERKAAQSGPETAAAELAALKAKLAAMEADKATDQPKPTVSTTAQQDPLAMAIAKAIEPMITQKLDREAVLEMIREHMKPATYEIVVKTPDIPEGVNMGRQHKQFEELLIICNCRTKDGYRLNVWMAGPAGTGKSTAARMVARALGLKFASTGSLTDTYKLFGFVKPSNGEPVITAFRDIWTNGGVFLLDDFDGSDPTACVEANHPFANGHFTFPDGESVERHADCVIILTANTWGHGATNEFVGRYKQDGAFLDRFVKLNWDIDEDLERDFCGDASWVEYVQKVRRNVAARGLKVLVTPRATYHGEALLKGGMPLERVKALTMANGMTPEQWSSVC